MAWQNEMVVIIRHLISDLDSTDYSYSDERLQETIIVSAQLVKNTLDFDVEYTIDVDQLTLSPDPTESSPKDDSFISLVSLKTACIILTSEFKTKSLSSGVVIKDGPHSIDTRGLVAGLQKMRDDACKAYEDSKFEYLTTKKVNGKVILGPYSPGSEYVHYNSRNTNRFY